MQFPDGFVIIWGQENRIDATIETWQKELVMCRNCKYYNPKKDDSWSSETCDHPLLDATDPYEWYGLRVEPDDFCSRGERRTDALN